MLYRAENLREIVLNDEPVSNKACIYVLCTCILYNAWKPPMNTSLITDVLGAASHAEESCESSNMMFSNSDMKLWISSLLSLVGVHILLTCLWSSNFLQKFLIRLHCFSFVEVGFVGDPCFGGCRAVLFVMFTLAMPTLWFLLAC